MPNMIQFISKRTNEPEKFAAIDNALCAHFNVTPDPVRYYFNWYNCLGLACACGHGFDTLRNDFPELLPIIDYLDANYAINAWHSHTD